jgi:hypothetical protein
MKRIIHILTISMFISSCGISQDNSAPPSNKQESPIGEGSSGEENPLKKSKEKLKDSLQTDELASTVAVDNGTFVFTVENNQDQDAEIFFSSGQEFDYVVSDKDGKQVKKLSEDRMYTQATKEILLAPGEKLEYPISYEEVTADLPQGEYTIEFIFADANHHASAKESFQVE